MLGCYGPLFYFKLSRVIVFASTIFSIYIKNIANRSWCTNYIIILYVLRKILHLWVVRSSLANCGVITLATV